jgi:hypothetical protein
VELGELGAARGQALLRFAYPLWARGVPRVTENAGATWEPRPVG